LEKNFGVANENIVSTLRTLGKVSDRSVPIDRVLPGKKECLVVLHLNDPSLSLPYCVVRGQQTYTDALLSKKRREYPNVRVVLEYSDHPNAIELWNAIKATLGKRLLFFANTNTFSINSITEEKFVEIVNECDVEKRREHDDMLEKIVVSADEDREQEPDRDEDREEEQEERSVTPASLLLLTVRELKQICRNNHLKGWSQLRKLELVECIVSQ
jgi:hypothetical protein